VEISSDPDPTLANPKEVIHRNSPALTLPLTLILTPTLGDLREFHSGRADGDCQMLRCPRPLTHLRGGKGEGEGGRGEGLRGRGRLTCALAVIWSAPPLLLPPLVMAGLGKPTLAQPDNGSLAQGGSPLVLLPNLLPITRHAFNPNSDPSPSPSPALILRSSPCPSLASYGVRRTTLFVRCQ
jgi:hypothetical protein